MSTWRLGDIVGALADSDPFAVIGTFPRVRWGCTICLMEAPYVASVEQLREFDEWHDVGCAWFQARHAQQ